MVTMDFGFFVASSMVVQRPNTLASWARALVANSTVSVANPNQRVAVILRSSGAGSHMPRGSARRGNVPSAFRPHSASEPTRRADAPKVQFRQRVPLAWGVLAAAYKPVAP